MDGETSEAGISIQDLGISVPEENAGERLSGEEMRFGKSYDDKQEEARRVLTRVYTKFCPKKLGDIDGLLEAYEGQEDELIESVVTKYEKPKSKPHERQEAGRRGNDPPERQRRRSSAKARITGAMSAAKAKARTMSVGAVPRRRSAKKKFNTARSMEGFGGGGDKTPGRKSGIVARARGAKNAILRRSSRSQNDNDMSLNSPIAMPSPTHKQSWRDKRKGSFGGGSSMPPRHHDPRDTSRQLDNDSSFDVESKVGENAPSQDLGEKNDVGEKDLGENDTESAEDPRPELKAVDLRHLKGRERFVAFFTKYDPPMIEHVDSLLRHGSKTEQQLWNELQAKYGVNQKERLLVLLKCFEPSKARNVDDLLYRYEGKEEELIAYYATKYKPLMEKMEGDPKTWATGAANTYQQLPGRDLGD